ncbi:hypothetical protein O0L34_g10710 [Tuta absoluta]|nr:hypothetical protein O0L34_g10710 [Tuta absoluta]
MAPVSGNVSQEDISKLLDMLSCGEIVGEEISPLDMIVNEESFLENSSSSARDNNILIDGSPQENLIDSRFKELKTLSVKSNNFNYPRVSSENATSNTTVKREWHQHNVPSSSSNESFLDFDEFFRNQDNCNSSSSNQFGEIPPDTSSMDCASNFVPGCFQIPPKMSLWARAQQLPPDSLQKVRAIYGEHFPIEVRHCLSHWIENRIWTQETDENQRYFLDELLTEIQTQADLMMSPDTFLTKMKLMEAAKVFHMHYSHDPHQLYLYMRRCLAMEMEVIQSAGAVYGAVPPTERKYSEVTGL